MKNNPSSLLLQENVYESSIQLAQQRRELLKSNPAQVVKGFSLATRQVYDYLVRVSAYHDKVYLSHDRIGQIVRKSRRQVVRVLKTLREWGLISWHTPERNWKNHLANEYFVDPIVRDLKFRKGAGYWIWGLRVLPLVLLVSNIALSKARAERDVTPIKNIDIYQSVSESVSVDSLSISRVVSCKNTNYRIRYTKVKPGLTNQERRNMHIEQMKHKEQAITAIKLTKIGVIHFTPFDLEAIKEANYRLQTVPGKIDNPIGYMKKLCLDWHKKHNKPTDFSFSDQMFTQYPEFKSLPVYEDDGRVHKLSVSQVADLTAAGEKIDPRDYGIDPEAQVQYQPNQSRQSSVVGEAPKVMVNRTSPYSPYTPFKSSQVDRETLDRGAEFKKAADHFRAEIAAGNKINQYAQYLIDLDNGQRIVQDEKGNSLQAWQAMVKAMTGVTPLSNFSVAEISKRLIAEETPSPLQPRASSTERISQFGSDDAPFFEPQTNDDQLYEEIDPIISY